MPDDWMDKATTGLCLVYSRAILGRVGNSFWRGRKPVITLVGNLSFRNNPRVARKAYAEFKRLRGNLHYADAQLRAES